jgi:molybdopterin synthase sulfur carrier subunit
MGRVKIRFFASFREKIGLGEMYLEINHKTTVGHVIDRLTVLRGELRKLLKDGSAIIAVNQEVADPDSIVQDGDEIAIFPPVSGG